MKRLLPLIFVCFCATAAKAQYPKADTVKFRSDPSYRDALMAYLERNTVKKQLTETKPGKPYALDHPKPGVYSLRQDKMRCIVPDMKDIAAIPNVHKGEIKVPYTGNPPHIPNATSLQRFQYRAK